MRVLNPLTKSASASLLILVPLLVLTGCEEPRHVGKRGGKSASAVEHAPAKPAEPEFIVGKRTQEVLKAAPELQNQGAQQVEPRIVGKDYITLQGNAYVSMIGQTSILSIQHAMDLYHATNDRYPKDYDEFMNEIIKANNIALPQLPVYQKYAYDEKEHKLVIYEYPALKGGG